jgi:hypothetical protein
MGKFLSHPNSVEVKPSVAFNMQALQDVLEELELPAIDAIAASDA